MKVLNMEYSFVVSIDDVHVQMATTATPEPIRRNKCLEILQQTIQIFNQFRLELNKICESLQIIPIEYVIHFFPDIEQAENDIQLLQPLIDQSIQPKLLSIIRFWKDRTRIEHVRTGILHLSNKFSAANNSIWLKNAAAVNQNSLAEQCALIYNQYQNEIVAKYPEKIVTLISYYGSSADLFTFLDSLKMDDIDHLKEAVNDRDESLVDTKVIFDIDIVKNFLSRAYQVIQTKQNQSNNTPIKLEHIIESFMEVWKNEQFTDLLKCLQSSSLSLSSIKRIHLELTDKEQSKRRQIADILQKSSIGFIRIGYHQATFDVSIELPTEKDKKQQKLTFADIGELRDRARLLEYSSNVNQKNLSPEESERDKKRLGKFIYLTSILESTIEILNNLYTTGYPNLSQFLSDQMEFSCINEMFNELEKNNQILVELFKDWEEQLCEIYQKYIGLTYFSGNQFWLIEDYIYRRSSTDHQGYHLLKYIDIDPNSIEKPEIKSENADDRLMILGHSLSGEYSKQSCENENIQMKKCYLVETTNEGILRAILSLFQYTKTKPAISRVFYCNHHTNWIEVRAFVYRCFYSQSFHQIIRPELLSQSIQDQFINLLRSLIEQQPNHVFRMGIITTISPTDQQMINGLQSMDILNVLRDHQLLNKNDFSQYVQNMIRNCQLVTSQITGLGKSTLIRQKIEKSGKNYVKFSINGDFDIDTLAERLASKHTQLQRAAIHLDIGTIDNIQQLNEILYSLLLFGSFRFGEVAVSIPTDTSIYIELDASPQSTLNETHFFEHIKSRIEIKNIDWENLDFDNIQIQTVANYFQAIDNGMIVQKNLDPATFSKLNQATCSALIQKHFLLNKNVQFITWTQLSIFTSIFYRLFTSFSRCGYFLLENVPNPQVRMDVIQALLRSSNQFTSLSVENVRKQQRSVATDQPIHFSNAIIRWDKIQPFTLILTDTDDPLFVYKQTSNIPPALIEYFQIYLRATRQKQQQQDLKEENIFPNYDNLNHIEFFIKLASLSRKYFNKSICPKCYRQFEYKTEECQQCLKKEKLLRPDKSFKHLDIIAFQTYIAERLQNEYILTADNFVKMLLVYMRVQAGIPVLIMGETGTEHCLSKMSSLLITFFASRLWKNRFDSIFKSENTR